MLANQRSLCPRLSSWFLEPQPQRGRERLCPVRPHSLPRTPHGVGMIITSCIPPNVEASGHGVEPQIPQKAVRHRVITDAVHASLSDPAFGSARTYARVYRTLSNRLQACDHSGDESGRSDLMLYGERPQRGVRCSKRMDSSPHENTIGLGA